MISTDDQFRNQFNMMEESIQQYLRNSGSSIDGRRSSYTIPTVVHVVHLGESVGSGSNVSDSAIVEYIEVTNQQLANYNGFGADTDIQLCLAKVDPNGNSTTGINRVSGADIPFYSEYGIKPPGSACTGANQTAIKSLSRWPYTSYYNVWVVHNLCNGTSGFANFPGNFPDVDGTVILYTAVDWQYHALTHETGHYFGLYHTFEGQTSSCPSSLYGCGPNAGDCCNDTPIHTSDNVSSVNPCTSQGIWDNSRYNHMSYNQDTDSLRFTSDQVDRLHAALNVHPRSALLNSDGCSVVGVVEQLEVFMSISPNPTSDYLNISTNDGKKVSYFINDSSGRIVMSGEFIRNHRLSLHNLVPGFYFIQAVTEEGNFTKQFMKI